MRTLEEAVPVSSRTSDTGGGTHVIEDTRFAKDLSQHHVHVHSACLELVVRKSQARTYVLEEIERSITTSGSINGQR